jgi:N-acyl-D-amino-acid deacylase
MKVVAKHQKICTVHLKSEGNDLENALQTMLDAARAAGLKKLHLSHLKTAGKQNFRKLPVILDALASSDIRVTGDIYCYDAGMSQLSIILPSPYDEYDDITVSKLLSDDKTFEKVLQQVDCERKSDYWRNVRIISAAVAYKQYEQLLMHEAAEQACLPPSRLFLEILRCDSAAARAAFHTLSLENMRQLAAHESVVPGSDESARNSTFAFGSSHPRGFGNHAEYFNLRRSQNAAIGEIISEMSMNIAEIFNIPNIGAIRCGNKALFAVIDPDFYRAQSTFANPHQLCRGAELLNLQEA